MDTAAPTTHRFVVHGLAVELACDVDAIMPQLARTFEMFATSLWPDGFLPTVGAIRPYQASDVVRRLSPTATAIHPEGSLVELYEDHERYWLIDDRWGLCEINLLKNQFRSWIIPHPTVDSVRCMDMAVLWPLAQLLRAKGLHLLPAAAVARGEWGVLILTPFGIEPELRALINAGYQIVAQRWTAVREEEGKISLLSVPGQVETDFAPRLRCSSNPIPQRWLDLTAAYAGSARHHAFCDTVVAVIPGRRPRAKLLELSDTSAATILRRDWPIVELHPHRRGGQLPNRLVQYCRCAEAHLSRNAEDFVLLLESMRPMASVFKGPRKVRTQAPPSWKPQSLAS